jgi:hypothetical protein
MEDASPSDVSPSAPDPGGRPHQKDALLDRFFRSAPAPPLDLIQLHLWKVPSDEWSAQDSAYRMAILEQYRIYAELADRISSRRGQANTFFLTLNTTIFNVFGLSHIEQWIHVLFALACTSGFLLVMCS